MTSAAEAATWYAALIKPSWAPPAWAFGPAWAVLYTIIAISFGYVAWRVYQGTLPAVTLVPFGLNLVFNVAFSPIQFILRNNVLATVDCVLILVTLVWAMVTIWPEVRWVALVNIPYLLWVTFATALQAAITRLNG